MESFLNKYLVIIPARAGSKRIPHKNTVPFIGRPLIEHTFEFVQSLPSEIGAICSTNDTKVEEIAKSFSRIHLHKRSDDLAKDTTGDFEVIQNCLLNFKGSANNLVVIYLRPTSPFRDKNELLKIIEMMESQKYSSIRSMLRSEGVHHPYWSFKSENGMAKPFIDGIDLKKYYQSQTLPLALRLTGTYDLFSAKNLESFDDIYGPSMGAFEITVKNSLDIDTLEDLKYGEFLAKNI